MRTPRTPMHTAARAGAAVALMAVAAGAAAGQSLPRKVWNDVRWAAEDVFFVVTSPVQPEADGWMTAAWVAGATGVALVVDDEVDRWIVRNPSSFAIDLIGPFTEGQDALYHLGSGSLMVQVSGVLYLAGLVFDSQGLRDAGIGCAVAEKTQSAIRHGIYRAVSRRRPESADGDPFIISVPGGDWPDHSFFGGHGANAMTCAAFWTRRFDLSYAEPVILGAALGVNIGRVIDRKHWLSDAVVGAVFGYAMGKGMADRQRSRARGSADDGRPGDSSPFGGLYLDTVDGAYLIGWRHTF